tara:strand:+ start:265 stop:468 length:204 start_codon:yes stop_codon:yes gene_type:complete
MLKSFDIFFCCCLFVAKLLIMKFLGFLIFVFVFLMAFWCLIFLASVVPYFIFVWFMEGKLENDQIPN